MALKLFKRRSKKKQIDEEVEQTLTKNESNQEVGHSTSTAEQSFERDEGLYFDKDSQSDKNGGDTNVHVISAKDGADVFKASDVRDSMLRDEMGFKSKRTLTVPTAKDSAYSGPPRYDWIDVEAAAAIKIQSVFRRHLVLKKLEEEGKSTAAMRNKIRSRNAKKKYWNSEDVPTMFRFCGIGYLFADATGEDTYAYDREQAVKKDEQFNAKINKDKKLRKFRMRQKSDFGLEEAVEVVDNIDHRTF